MDGQQLMTRAAATTAKVVGAIEPSQLTAPTPCAEYDVRSLVNHLLFWGPSLEAAARKEARMPPAAAESEIDLTSGDWTSDLAGQLRRTADAWSDPAAWDGVTPLGGQDSPAPLIGGMVLVEFVVHGWDLARATGQQTGYDDDVLAYVHNETLGHAPFGREMGLYGPEVPVSPDAPLLDRTLGLTGRDPNWTRT
ncbi:TIGR03086 family metal-binding protein [Kribbella catacumbae]|uniref:TIGR03086 family metal-binding protein n=1 Tax=Kribbella catacumbae TaxID=460086 RepID=UPI0004761B5B|nr:TIGR03086 family metal-binding protein [Kribbella catacumbae]